MSMEIIKETEKVKTPKGIIVKYCGTAFPGKVRFGKFKSYSNWVKFIESQRKNGTPVLLCMWYFTYKDEDENSNFKEMYNDPNFGSAYLKWDDNTEDDD